MCKIICVCGTKIEQDEVMCSECQEDFDKQCDLIEDCVSCRGDLSKEDTLMTEF